MRYQKYLVLILLISILGTILSITSLAENTTKKEDPIKPMGGPITTNIILGTNVTKEETPLTADTSPTSIQLPYSATYSMIDYRWRSIPANSWTEVTNYSFYLPKNSYVSIESSGQAYFFNYMAIEWTIDGGWDSGSYRSYYDTYECYYCGTGFQTSRGYYLGTGWHTIRLYGYDNDPYDSTTAYFTYISITAIANPKGDFQFRT